MPIFKNRQKTDKVKNITLYKKNLTIDGNNHAIDGNGKTTLFKIEKGDVTLKNIVLRNFNDTAIILIDSKLTTLNVTFENITGADYGAAIYCTDNSAITSTNDKFIENYAPRGGSAIFGYDSVININNGTFENKNPIYWSLIYGDDSEVNVYETTFANINSKYATAIYNTYNTTIKKSKFINLHADATAGAVAIKSKNEENKTFMRVYDCEFINVRAAKNGGAIFSAPITQYTRMITTEGKNYLIDSTGKFIDAAKSNVIVPVKAYTFKNPQISETIVKYYSTNETIFTVNNVYETDALSIRFDDKNMTMTIVNGSGSVNLGVLDTGANPVFITYKNQTFASIIYIKPTIDCENTYTVTVAYNTKLPLDNVKFYDSDGNPLENVSVIVKFDNKTIPNTVTGVNGSIPIVINAGNKIGTHYVDYANPTNNETARITVKILSRFSGNSNVNMYYFDGHKYKVRIRGDNGKFVGKNHIITIKIGKKSFKVKTDSKGYATLKIPKTITPGKYTISVKVRGQTVKNKLTVKQVLKTTKTVKVKKSAKKLTLKTTLKKGKIALKNKVVKFKVNGKTYKAKTNKKGIATVTLKKAVINKLKVKKYSIKVSYLNDVVKSTLQVRR